MSDSFREKSKTQVSPLSSAGVVVEGRYIPPPEDKEGKLWVRTSALIHAEAAKLYQIWRDVELAPKWQEQIVRVVRTAETTSHWVMRAGDDSIEWDAVILADEPGRRIAWKSIGGDSDNAGEVIFDKAPGDRGTLVTVLQEFRMNRLTKTWETLVGRNPKQAVIENLRHFKALAETGEIPRTEGQPHGPRGTGAGIKRSMYGETILTPPGNASTAKTAGGKR